MEEKPTKEKQSDIVLNEGINTFNSDSLKAKPIKSIAKEIPANASNQKNSKQKDKNLKISIRAIMLAVCVGMLINLSFGNILDEFYSNYITLIVEKTAGIHSAHYVSSVYELAKVYERHNKLLETEKHYQNALRIAQLLNNADQLQILQIKRSLASMYYGEENYQKAYPYYLTFWQNKAKFQSLDWPVKHMLFRLSYCELATERYEDAFKHFNQLYSMSSPKETDLYARLSLWDLGYGFYKVHRYDEAITILLRALTEYEHNEGVNSTTANAIRNLLSDIEQKSKQEKR
jgi:tetratricopeptide (TPR) repeat protein